MRLCGAESGRGETGPEGCGPTRVGRDVGCGGGGGGWGRECGIGSVGCRTWDWGCGVWAESVGLGSMRLGSVLLMSVGQRCMGLRSMGLGSLGLDL